MISLLVVIKYSCYVIGAGLVAAGIIEKKSKGGKK
jgi:hypothetical protein